MHSRLVRSFLLVALVSLPVHAAAQSRDARPDDRIPPGVPLQALLDEINALKARVAKLESGQVDAPTMVGRYALQLFGIELEGNPAVVGVDLGGATMTLQPNFDVTFSASADSTDVACRLRQRQGMPWVVLCEPPDDSPETITWRVENGMLVLSENGRDTYSPIGAGGQLFIFTDARQQEIDAPRTASWSVLGIAVRLPD